MIESSAYPISSVWRFGRDSRHLTIGGKEDLFHERCTITDLQSTRISSGLRVWKGVE